MAILEGSFTAVVLTTPVVRLMGDAFGETEYVVKTTSDGVKD
jgi:hypothetical protein